MFNKPLIFRVFGGEEQFFQNAGLLAKHVVGFFLNGRLFFEVKKMAVRGVLLGEVL
jgi:hypothetical protein